MSEYSKISNSSKKKWRRNSLERPNVEQITDTETDFNKFTKLCDNPLRSFTVTADGHFVSLGPSKLEASGCAYYDAQLKLKILTCKSTPLIPAFEDFPHLFSLNLDYCNLTCDDVKLLEDSLKSSKTVKELSLVGNRNQNFHRLIACGLRALCLKLCNITEQGVQKMAEEYVNLGARQEPATLIHLDVSFNPIFDKGCRHLAAILRCNRTLRSLNLTDCKITPKGVETLALCFAPFNLNQQELTVRRKIRFDYYRLREKVDSLIGQSDSPPDGALKDKLTVSEVWLKQHPFTNQDSVQLDGEVRCKGNYSLETLNLSYNHLSKLSLELLLNVLTGQAEGLKRLVLEGCAPNCSELKNAIQECANARTGLKKRRSSAGKVV